MNCSAKDGMGLAGVGAAACAACCIGPLLAFLSGLSIAGVAAAWLIGGAGLVLASIAAITFTVVRRRRRTALCAVDAAPVLVGITSKSDR